MFSPKSQRKPERLVPPFEARKAIIECVGGYQNLRLIFSDVRIIRTLRLARKRALTDSKLAQCLDEVRTKFEGVDKPQPLSPEVSQVLDDIRRTEGRGKGE